TRPPPEGSTWAPKGPGSSGSTSRRKARGAAQNEVPRGRLPGGRCFNGWGAAIQFGIGGAFLPRGFAGSGAFLTPSTLEKPRYPEMFCPGSTQGGEHPT